MNAQDNVLNLAVGAGGTGLALILTQDGAAIAAGLATVCWMVFQIGAGIYDRRQRRRDRENDN